MNRRKFLILMSLCALSVSAYASVYAASVPSVQQYDTTTLTQVEALYGLSEDAAVTRLAREYDAAVQAQRIEARHLPSYAGAWFDSATQSLHVAVSSKADFDAIERVGATPVLVAHSLTELDAARMDVTDALTSNVARGSVRESYIDIQANAVVLGISKGTMEPASAFMATRARANVPVQLKLMVANPGFSTNLLGADGTENHTWDINPLYTGTHPCSVGANAEKVSGATYVAGYATAGHCNSVNDIIWTRAGTSLGTVNWSTFNVST